MLVHRRQPILSALIMLWATACSALAAGEHTTIDAKVCQWFDGRRAAVSLRFDDSHPTHVLKAAPMLREFELKGTFMINPGNPGYQQHKDLWEGMMVAQGHEFGNHTMHHRGARSDAEGEAEIGGCSRYIDEPLSGSGLTSLVRGGATLWMMRKPVEYFLAKYNLFKPGSDMSLSEAYPGVNFEAFRNRLDRTVQTGGWLRAHFHQIQDEGGLWISEDLLRQIFAHLHDRRDVVWVAGITDIYKYEQQRSRSTLLADASGKDALTLHFACAADARLFDHPLTLQVSLPAAGAVVVRDAEGAVVPSHIVEEGGRRLARFEVPPVDARYTVKCAGLGAAYARQEGPLLPAPGPHPYVFFTKADLAELRERAAKPPTDAMWEQVKGEADRILIAAPPDPNFPKEDKPHERARSGASRAWLLAFAYVLTGDMAYADRARPEIEAALAAETWVHPRHSGDADLVSAEVACGLAMAYDWMYDALSDDERNRLRQAVIRRGLEPIFRATEQRAWWSHWYRCNWGAVIFGQAGVAALALLAEEPRAASWVRICRQKIWHYTEAVGRDGGWGESVSYAGYAWFNAVLFMDAYHHVTRGEDNLFAAANLRALPLYFTHLLLPDESGFVPFSNCWEGRRLSGEFLYRLAAEYQDGRAQWMAERMASGGGRGSVFGLLWRDTTLAPTPPDDLPTTRLFRDIDWAVFRSAWNDRNATLFAFKGGQKDWDHHHHDTNHFVLYSRGRPLITDLLYPHDVWGCETEAHNTIMVNGRGQRGRVRVAGGRGEPEHRGVLGDLVDEPWYTRLVGDASLAYEPEDMTSFVREVIYVRGTTQGDVPEYFVLFDDIEAPLPSRIDWHLHTHGKLTVKGNTVTIVQDEAAADVMMLAPPTFRYEVHSKSIAELSRLRPFAGAEKLTFVKLRPAEPVQQGRFVSVIVPRGADEPPAAKANLIQAPNVLGARIGNGLTRDTAFFALDGPEMEAEDISAVGRTCFVRRGPSGVLAAVLHHGTRLEANGRTLFESDGSGHAVVTIGPQRTTARLTVYDARTASVYAEKKPMKVRIDDRPVQFEYNIERQLVTLNVASGSHAIRLDFE